MTGARMGECKGARGALVGAGVRLWSGFRLRWGGCASGGMQGRKGRAGGGGSLAVVGLLLALG